MTASFPQSRRLTIRLDDSPRYRGSVHDDAVARAMGYRAALVPGAFLYGHFSRVAIEAWGLDWAARGGIGARFRRPVYNGDEVTIEAGPLVAGAGRVRSELALRDAEGETAASGWIDLPDVAEPAPLAADWPLLRVPDPRPEIGPGGWRKGMRGGTAQSVLTEAEWLESLAAFDETHPIYRRETLVHSGLLMRRAMGEVYGSFRFPGPVVLVSCETRHYAPVRPGARFGTSSIVSDEYERKGKHYGETDEVVFADGNVVSRHRRLQVYAG
ncbi:MaoC family dehydratase [Prosthecomicrobium sp. N25]|uniref:MaoC family dehydratase n=1 Tax=Prosthecomicrobium sp. N25 TaxID=3129254 RepID=UPI0030777C20